MLGNYTPTRGVNSYQTVFLRVGILIQRRVISRLDKTNSVALKTWSCSFLKKQDHIVTLKTSILQADRKKITVLV